MSALPTLIAVAPNGARKLKADHPAVPLTAPELAQCAAQCLEAGAAMIHLHVRQPDGRHSIAPELYRPAIAAIRQEVGDKLIIQCTSEAAGIYQAPEQIAAMRELMPEACSLGIREIVPDAASEKAAADFLAHMHKEHVLLQYILYSADDLVRFRDLVARGIVPGSKHFVLFVLGRYTAGQQSQPVDLLPFMQVWQPGWGEFAVCAFGKLEAACAITALGLGGHARVGFENNTLLADGSSAPDNAALVRQIAVGAPYAGRERADAASARAWLKTLD